MEPWKLTKFGMERWGKFCLVWNCYLQTLLSLEIPMEPWSHPPSKRMDWFVNDIPGYWAYIPPQKVNIAPQKELTYTHLIWGKSSSKSDPKKKGDKLVPWRVTGL